MICLRCGHCCIACDVIVPIPSTKKGIVVGAHKPYDEQCWNLSFEEGGTAVCAIHNKRIYRKSPCSCHTQIEEQSSPCRTGEWMLTKGPEILTELKKRPVAIPNPVEIETGKRRC